MEVDDKGLSNIKTLINLKELYLRETIISNEGLSSIKDFNLIRTHRLRGIQK